MIYVNDYVEGFEYFGTKVRKIKGWVDKVSNDREEILYHIQADDEYGGARGTILFTSLGEVKLINKDYPRPSKYCRKYNKKGDLTMQNITYKIEDLKDKKIVNIEKMRGEYGRTYDNYLCFTCEDGTRVMLYGGEPYRPEPSLEEMRKVKFFTPEEIGNKLVDIERKERQREKDMFENKKRELERLKKELGEV